VSEYVFRTIDPATGEITDEIPMIATEVLTLMDDVEGWKQGEDGGWKWTARHDPFEAAPDPRDVRI
jgi:hypothetical protein